MAGIAVIAFPSAGLGPGAAGGHWAKKTPGPEVPSPGWQARVGYWTGFFTSKETSSSSRSPSSFTLPMPGTSQ